MKLCTSTIQISNLRRDATRRDARLQPATVFERKICSAITIKDNFMSGLVNFAHTVEFATNI
jgi:hypothetical protein